MSFTLHSNLLHALLVGLKEDKASCHVDEVMKSFGREMSDTQ